MAHGNAALKHNREWEISPEREQTYLHPVTGEPLQVRHFFKYKALPTLKRFHACQSEIRGIVGPVGSGKTASAVVEICFRIPMMYHNRYGVDKTVWLALRNTYPMLIDSTQRTFFEWFPPSLYGTYNKQEKVYKMKYTTVDKMNEPCTLEVDILFRSCDRAEDVEKFRGYELTGYYIDESDEVGDNVKLMLKQRIGRYPRLATWERVLKKKFPHLRHLNRRQFQEELETNPEVYQTAFGVETTNPPSTESSTYYSFHWATDVPGPVAEKPPLPNHIGFWQPPYENVENLRPGYYDRMREMYGHARDWVERYIEGKPGIMLRGKNVYHNFSRKIHESEAKIRWVEGQTLYRGWDHTGHHPACIVTQMPIPRQVQCLREFYSDHENIVTFAKRVVAECNREYPGAQFVDYGDPAGWQKISKKDGSFTSHTQMMEEECGISLIKSDQNLDARINSVEQQLAEMVVGGEPALLVDPDCVRLINGFMGGYYYPQLKQNEEIFSDNPLKNRYADVHDALQYVIVKLRGTSRRRTQKRSRNFSRPRDPLLVS